MKKIAVYYLDASGAEYTFERGKFQVPKGKALAGIRLRLTAYLKNTGGAGVALSDTDRANIIKNFIGSFTFRYGISDENLARTPFLAVDGMQLRRHQRVVTGIDLNGYTDTTTGLKSTIANGGGDQAVVYTQILPFQAPWWFKNATKGTFAMGRAQAKTITWEHKRANADPVLSANLAVGANKWKVEVYPIYVDVEVDRYQDVPHYLEKDQDGQTTFGPNGLHLLVGDRNAAHASTSYTQYNLNIGEHVIHQELDPTAEREAELDEYNFLSSADVGDDITVLYRPPLDMDLEHLPSGKTFFEQPKDDYATTKLVYFYIPPTSFEDASAVLADLSSNVEKKALKAISLPSFRGERVAENFQPFAGMAIVDGSSGRFHTSVGLLAQPGGSVVPHLPTSKAKDITAALAAVKGGADAGAVAPAISSIQRSVASAFPGGLKPSSTPNAAPLIHPGLVPLLNAVHP